MIRVTTTNGNSLVNGIYNAIRSGSVVTWKANADGYITHSAASGQWENKAWFKPRIVEGGVIFNIFRPQGMSISKEVYAIYHGRCAEMLLAHFDTWLSAIMITALAGEGDVV
jgi:hypothetical protein